MKLVRVLIVLAFAVIIGVPVIARWRNTGSVRAIDKDTRTLIVITPHIEQIREEFGTRFSQWHLRVHGQPARIDWRTPGGTSEIRKQLEAQATAAMASGAYSIRPASDLLFPGREKDKLPEAVIDPLKADMPDVFFGGGSFEHSAMKAGIVVDAPLETGAKPQQVRVRIGARPTGDGFTQSYLDTNYGQNKVGVEKLYDPDQYWFGAALSGFGIVFNRDMLREYGVHEPTGFADLGNPKFIGRVAMADPRQSGSVATLYDAILNKEGWDRGWRILREMSANARYFSAMSTQPPQDVSAGECAIGVAIDFYGRGQAQSLLHEGDDPNSGRVGYIDPAGATYIDADPVTIINGSRNADLARRFVEFVLSDEGQALWQFAPLKNLSASAAPSDGLGPQEYRLRRMPVKRSMYEAYLPRFTDKTVPFDIAIDTPLRGWRDSIGPLMGAFGIDTRRELVAAWAALNAARSDPAFPKDRLLKMEELFYAMPKHTLTKPDGSSGETVILNETTYKQVADDTGKWRDPVKGSRAKIAYAAFFKGNYRKIVELGETR